MFIFRLAFKIMGWYIRACILAGAIILIVMMIVSCSPEDTQSAGTTTAASGGKGAGAAESPSVDTVKGTHRVLRVVDGDTVDVDYHGTTRVRVLGIDTPETVHPNKPVECGGPQASRAAQKLLDDKKITLAFNPEGDRIDKYDRALAYIQLPAHRRECSAVQGGGESPVSR